MEQALIRLTTVTKQKGHIRAKSLRMSFAAYIEYLIKQDLERKENVVR